jgi:hypothetical protein
MSNDRESKDSNKTLHPTAGNAPVIIRAFPPAADELRVKRRMKIITLLLSVLGCSCVNHLASSERPISKASAFFTDYVMSEGPAVDTLPIFLSACRGDQVSLDKIFSDYGRFGSGDSEAWGEVPDVLLEELGDLRFSSYVNHQDFKRKVTVLKWLGLPGSTLYEDPELKMSYPRTAAMQREIFASQSTARP